MHQPSPASLHSALFSLLLGSSLLSAQTLPSFQAAGFATISGYGQDKLTGGAGGRVVEVRDAASFQAAVERLDIKSKAERDNTPRIVKVMADIDLGTLANEKPGKVLTSVGRVLVRSHTTIFAPGAGAVLRHGTVELHGAHNVIIRNLAFRDLWEEDPSGSYDSLGWDYVRITNSGTTPSHHVWVDHCDFGKCYDGQLDITHGSDLVTVSWCHFSGDERGPQKKSMLIGHSSSEKAASTDQGHLNVTLHHNWWENIDDRSPRARFGNIHACNNFVSGAANATISVSGAVTLVENCVYRDARIATTFSHASDTVAKQHGGTVCIVGSLNLQPRPLSEAKDEAGRFENENNFRSSFERAQLRFNPPASFAWEQLNQLPYRLQPDPVEGLPELLQKQTGTGRVADAGLLKTGL